jgi:hypothetical protein
MPTGQILSEKCSQAVGLTTLVITILGMAASVALILVVLFSRRVDRERGPSFLDALYG